MDVGGCHYRRDVFASLIDLSPVDPKFGYQRDDGGIDRLT